MIDYSKLTSRQYRAVVASSAGEGADGREVCWPCTSGDVRALRRAAKRGVVREIRGVCEGCDRCPPGTGVPVFVEART